MLGVNAIQRHVITHAREIHTGAHNVIETLSGRLENRREILEDALRLGRNAPLDYLASGRVLADLTAEIDETTDFDRLGKRADRRRKFGRGNCGLADRKSTRLNSSHSSISYAVFCLKKKKTKKKKQNENK